MNDYLLNKTYKKAVNSEQKSSSTSFASDI